MNYKKLYQALVFHKEVGKDTYIGKVIAQIVENIEAYGYKVIQTNDAFETRMAIENDASIALLLLDHSDANTNNIIEKVKERGLEAPIFLLNETEKITELPNQIFDEITGALYLQEDTPSFMAKHVKKHMEDYLESIKTPFFGGMVDYVEKGNEMWLAPGHNGGVFYEKSPVGKAFFDHMGENFFRSDFNFVPDLGGIFDHSGAYGEAEKQAAEIFGADRTYFVLNGTSTSNKMVNNGILTKGDLVLFDRNNHKSHHHSALMLSGAIPVYMQDDRNPFGMVGPLAASTLNEKHIREQIKNNPLVQDKEAYKKDRPFRMAIIENCTYDGTIYNVQEIIDRVGHLCDYIFFDEAWGAFMKFHPLYAGHFGLGLNKLKDNDPGIVVTQSTHKQLAGLSQASQIHMKDDHLGEQKRRASHQRFNEVYMMHMSTSPFYPMFASLDVGAQMMKGKNGEWLWNTAIEMSIEMAKKIRALAAEFATNDDTDKQWFVDPFVPDVVNIKDSNLLEDGQYKWEDIDTKILSKEQQAWYFEKGAKWHGYHDIEDNYVMKDPTKLLFLTPGLDRQTGDFAEMGIPAPILKEYMREKGIVAEKADFYSILFLLTPAIERTKISTLVAEMVKFKDLYDNDALMEDALPEMAAQHPEFYKGRTLKAVCQEMHDVLKNWQADKLQKEMFEEQYFPTPVMTPYDAFQKFVQNEVEYVPMEEISGRVAATMALVYPPGIGVILPGERYDEKCEPTIKYFEMFQETNKKFPGFDNEIQGAYEEVQEDGSVKYYTYVIKED